MSNESGFGALLTTLGNSSRVFIQTHDFPDPDAIASAYGLHSLLAHAGIEARLCYKGLVDNAAINYLLDRYDILLVEYEQIDDMDPEDKIILVDGQKFNANMTDLPGNEIACIDHHPDNHKCAYKYADIRHCGACASIISAYFRETGIPLDQKTATLLLYGLRTDTDNMTRGVTAFDADAFRMILPLADENMARNLSGLSMREDDLRAFGKAIDTMRVKNRVGIARIPFPCEDYLIAMVADFILQIAGIDIAVVYSRRENGIKFSARTILPNVHCGNLLRECLKAEGGNAGGHSHMAGGFLPKEKISSLYDENLSWDEMKTNATEFRDHLIVKIGHYLGH